MYWISIQKSYAENFFEDEKISEQSTFSQDYILEYWPSSNTHTVKENDLHFNFIVLKY